MQFLISTSTVQCSAYLQGCRRVYFAACCSFGAFKFHWMRSILVVKVCRRPATSSLRICVAEKKSRALRGPVGDR